MHKGAHINIYIVHLLSYINNINVFSLVSVNYVISKVEIPAIHKHYILLYQYHVQKASFSNK